MGRIGAVTRKGDSVCLGIGRVMCGLATTYLTEDTLVLNQSTQSLGVLTECSLAFSSEYEELPNLLTIQPRVIKLKDEVQLSVNQLELTARNIALMLGLNLVSYIDGISGSINLGIDEQPVEIRTEVLFVYPNKKNYMALILPKTIIRVNNSTDTSNTDASALQTVFEARRADIRHGGNVIWNSAPLGKIIFDSYPISESSS